jgi:lipopolysaccharide transport system ATP-binding protein
MSDIAIRVEGMGKRYRLGHREPYLSLRDSLARAAKAHWQALRRLATGDNRARRGSDDKSFWALKDVNFEVKHGDVVGIIGRNGAGKSTLLKILSEITEPTTGTVDIYGRVGSLLEVGTGFHLELTGRENIYLSGAILGMKRQEINRQFAEIVAFAGVEKYLDTQVKHYSSGMYMRLAFAVAAHLKSEILLIDEALAVGDVQFQNKCLGKMKEVANDGRSVLFVSHNLGAVQSLCSSAILLEKGVIKNIGLPRNTVQHYLELTRDMNGVLNDGSRRLPPEYAEILGAWLEVNGVRTGTLHFDDSPDIVLRIMVRKSNRYSIQFVLRQEDGVPISFASSGLGQNWELKSGVGEVIVRARLPKVMYAEGLYSVDVMIVIQGYKMCDYIESALGFHVVGTVYGVTGWAYRQSFGYGHSIWEVAFSLEQ